MGGGSNYGLPSHHQHHQVVQAKKRMAPQPPTKIENDSYSTISTATANSNSPVSSVSEKSIKVKPALRKAVPNRDSWTAPSSTDRGSSGWIRVYCGRSANDDSACDPNRIIHVVTPDTVWDVARAMDLPENYTLWLTIDGGRQSRRLLDAEQPLTIQQEYLRRMGYADESRRSRLEIDPQLKCFIRFHVGPAELPACRGLNRSGHVDLLKGLVFPQWKSRPVAIVGSKLHIYGRWEVVAFLSVLWAGCFNEVGFDSGNLIKTISIFLFVECMLSFKLDSKYSGKERIPTQIHICYTYSYWYVLWSKWRLWDLR